MQSKGSINAKTGRGDENMLKTKKERTRNGHTNKKSLTQKTTLSSIDRIGVPLVVGQKKPGMERIIVDGAKLPVGSPVCSGERIHPSLARFTY